MPLNSSKNSKTFPNPWSQIKLKYKIYGLKWFIKLSFERFFRYIYFEKFQNSYSQYGEDLIVAKLLNHKKNIFYVDIGSNEPIKFNNTYHFYKQGHQGINIDPNKNLIDKYKDIRPRDLNLDIGITDQNSKLTFYSMDPHVNSTLSKKQYKVNLTQNAILIKKINIDVLTFDKFYKTYCQNKTIDFLSLDTEGQEIKILKTIPWSRCHPKVICLETYHDSNLVKYMLSKNYYLAHSNNLNSIFIYENKNN